MLIKMLRYFSIASFLFIILLSSVNAFQFARSPIRSMSSVFGQTTGSSYQLNPKDLLLADGCSGLSRAEINEFVLQVK